MTPPVTTAGPNAARTGCWLTSEELGRPVFHKID